MVESLIIREEYLDNITRVSLSGEIDIYTSSKFKDRLYHIIDLGKTDLKIDCSQLDYIDSTGLGIFAGALKRVKQYGNNVYLIGLKNNIRKLFTITSLDKLFIIEE